VEVPNLRANGAEGFPSGRAGKVVAVFTATSLRRRAAARFSIYAMPRSDPTIFNALMFFGGQHGQLGFGTTFRDQKKTLPPGRP